MLKEMIVEKGRKYSVFLTPIGYFLCSVITAFASMENSVTATIVCILAGAVAPVCTLSTSVGAIAVYLFSGNVDEKGFLICSLILITVGKWIMREECSSSTSSFITLISMCFSGLVFGFVVDGSPYSAAINILYSILSAAGVYYIQRALDILGYPSGITADRKTLTALSVLFVLFTSVMSGITLSFLNVGIILSCLIILCACRFFGCVGGVICGVLTTAGIILGDRELGIQTVFFGAAGLMAGFLSKCSRITLASVFSGTILLGQLAGGMNDLSFFVQADIITGGILFMIIPERLVSIGGRFCAATVKDSSDMLGKEIAFAAKSLSEVRKNIIDVMKAFEQRQKSVSVSEKVCERICSKCKKRLECWEKNYESTNAIFRKMENGKSESIFIETECINNKKLLDEFEKVRREDSFAKMLSVRLNENRSFLFSQMEVSEDIVSALSERVSVSISKSVTATLCRALEKNEFAYNSAAAFYSGDQRLIVEIYATEDEKYDTDRLCSVLSHELGVALEYSKPFVSDGEMRLRLNQQTRYSVELGSFQLSAEKGDACGDVCGYFTDGLGYGYAYLSDGMGQGSRAAVDSQLTAALFKRFIRMGMSCEGAVKMINTVLLARSSDESFATLDIAKINLETGGVTLCKSGASSTLVKYGDSVMLFSFPSNPVGIIHNMSSTVKECDFSEGNILVMTSDGVPENSYMYIKEQLSAEVSLNELSENICKYSRKITSGNQPDDITAMSIKLVKNRENELIDTHI